MINNDFLYPVLLIFPLLLAATIEMMALPRIIYIAKKKNIYDIPSGRKSHVAPIPRLAGITFFPILLFVVSVFILVQSAQTLSQSILASEPALKRLFGLIGGSVLLWLIGIKDDVVGVRYRDKMLVQLISAIILVSGNLYINDFNGLFGIGEIPVWVGVPFTVLLVMFITNSINLIDGADGLASGISGVAFISLGTFFLMRGMYFYSLICVILVGILIPFFYYNVFKTSRKIFMGDTGSLTLGFLLAYLGVRFAMDVPHAYNAFEFSSPVMISLSALFIPLFDALRVMLERACVGKSMFMPDRRHIHHKLLDLGFSHRKVMVSLVFCSALLVVLNVLVVSVLNINIVFVMNIALWLGLITFLNIQLKK